MGCKGKQMCGRCGGNHKYGKCKDGTKMKCANYGGAHSVPYGGCKVRKKVVEVQKLMSLDISYMETVKVVQREHKVERRGKKNIREGTAYWTTFNKKSGGR